MRKIILASTSPRRKELLQKTGLPFTIVASNYEEDMTLPMPPKALVKHLSRGKAEAVAEEYADAIVIGADTIVVLGKQVLGKPHTPERAREMLRSLSGKSHSVITGFTVIDTASKKIVSKAVESKVFFRKLTNKDIEWYIASQEPLDKAGAYAIQEKGGLFVKKVVGDYCGVVGLPLIALAKELQKCGVDMFQI